MPQNEPSLNLADDEVLRAEVQRAANRAIQRGTHSITTFAVLLACAIEVGQDLAGASLLDLVESVRVMWREVQNQKKDQLS